MTGKKPAARRGAPKAGQLVGGAAKADSVRPEDVQKRLWELAEGGLPLKHSLAMVGVSWATWLRWQRGYNEGDDRYQELFDGLYKAQAVHVEDLKNRLLATNHPQALWNLLKAADRETYGDAPPPPTTPTKALPPDANVIDVEAELSRRLKGA